MPVVKSIIGSAVFKLASSAIAFVCVPILLKLLGTHNYATWVTLTALIAWLNLFDFGSGYSLKNKVTESLVQSENSNINVLVAGTIQFYFISTLIIMIVFIVSTFFVKAFVQNPVLTALLYLPVILSFPFTVGNFIIQGLKKFNLFNSLLLAQSGLWLITVLLFRYKIIQPDIFKVAIAYSSIYAIINLTVFVISLRLIGFNWKDIFRFKHLIDSKKSLMVGGRFFLLQISSLLLFSLGNIMTYNNLQLKDVAEFDTVNKVYLLGMTIFNVLISVFWSEISHAKALKDIQRLKKIQKELLFIASGFSVGTIIVTFFVPYLIGFWTQGIIMVKPQQLIPFALQVCIQFFAYVGAVILNAFEELKGQVLLAIIASLFIIPLAKYFFSLKFGIGSVPAAAAILIIPTLIYVHYKSNSCIQNLGV